MESCRVCGKMNCYAHGGEAKMTNPRERGVHHQREGAPSGQSNMGTMVRRGDTEMAKRQAIDKKKDQRNASSSWRPLEGLAHGGQVKDRMNMYAMEPDVPAMHGYDEGGDVEMNEDDIDNELNDMAAQELMEALEKKDKKAVLESIRALVMYCGGKV